MSDFTGGVYGANAYGIDLICKLHTKCEWRAVCKWGIRQCAIIRCRIIHTKYISAITSRKARDLCAIFLRKVYYGSIASFILHINMRAGVCLSASREKANDDK